MSIRPLFRCHDVDLEAARAQRGSDFEDAQSVNDEARTPAGGTSAAHCDDREFSTFRIGSPPIRLCLVPVR